MGVIVGVAVGVGVEVGSRYGVRVGKVRTVGLDLNQYLVTTGKQSGHEQESQDYDSAVFHARPSPRILERALGVKGAPKIPDRFIKS